MERLSDGKRQEKLAKAFKEVISAGLVAPVFVSAAACGKEQPAVEEAQADEPTTAIIKTTPENKETQPVVEEAASPEVEEAKPIEWEGIVIIPIEGLRFDNGAFFAQGNNPYGLEVETKAGVFIKDAFKFNGEMENSIGLRPEVIKVLQQKHLEENKELRFPIPFNLEKNKDIKMELLENKYNNEAEHLDKYRLDKYTFWGITLPKDTIIYAPLDTKITSEWDGCLLGNYIQGRNDCHSFSLRKTSGSNEEIFYKGVERIDWWEVNIFTQGSELLISFIKVNKEGYNQTETDIGVPLSVIKNEPDPELDFYFKWGNPDVKNLSANMFFHFRQYEYDEKKDKYLLSKELETGEDIFLEMNKIKISIFPTPADE
jgi:hypothetical protein